ncbi:MAG: hypothetical protein ACOYMK_07480 [Hyphomonadaceae bacterium]
MISSRSILSLAAKAASTRRANHLMAYRVILALVSKTSRLAL